jgi:endonuclease G
MPSAAIIHTACFAVGAVVGGGVVSAVSFRKRQIPASTTSVDTSVARVAVPPIIEMAQSGNAKISNAVAVSTLPPPVLKYGHPGEFLFGVDLGSATGAQLSI